MTTCFQINSLRLRNSLLICAVTILAACTPEVGSEKWCAMLDAKEKGDWTINQAKDYAKHCLFDIN